MQITGKVKAIELDNIILSGLKGSEAVCNESLEPFTPGDQVVVISMAKVNDDSEVVLDDAIFVIKTKAAKDFLARFIDNLDKTESLVKP